MKLLMSGILCIGMCMSLVAGVLAGDIYQAVEAGDLDQVKAFVQTNRDLLNQKNSDALTPLNLAAVHGKLPIVKYLVDAGGDMTIGDREGSTPIHNAAANGRVDVVRYLLDRGINIDLRDNFHVTPLSFAAFGNHPEVARLLIQRGAAVNVVNDHGLTPLNNAVSRGADAIVDMILTKDVTINVPDKQYGFTPLHWAALRGNIDISRKLIERGARVGDLSNDGKTPLFLACSRGHLDLVKYLVEKGAALKILDAGGDTVLMGAVRGGHLDMVRYLMGEGFDVNHQGRHGLTPLTASIWSDSSEMSRLILDAGAKPNIRDDDGMTALHRALQSGKPELARLFLDRGANPDLQEKQESRTAVHLAVIQGYGEVVAAMIQKECNFNVRDSHGHTPLHYAVNYGHGKIGEMIRKNGGNGVSAAVKKDFMLNQTMESGDAVMWYLGHCGWAVMTQNNFLIFDYWKRGNLPDEPSILNGTIDPAEIADKNVYVFVTHAHRDHFDERIFEWEKTIRNITYIYGFDPGNLPQYRETPYVGPDFTFMEPRTTKRINGLEVTTIRSNDGGVGFMVGLDGVTLFHAGDHAGWHEGQRAGFIDEIDFLADRVDNLDVAFLNVTGCHTANCTSALEEGNRYVVDTLKPDYFIPTHASGREYVYLESEQTARENGWKTQVICPNIPGDTHTIHSK